MSNIPITSINLSIYSSFNNVNGNTISLNILNNRENYLNSCAYRELNSNNIFFIAYQY